MFQVFVLSSQVLILMSCGWWDEGNIPCCLLLLPTILRIVYTVYMFISWFNNFYLRAKSAVSGFEGLARKKVSMVAVLGPRSSVVRAGGVCGSPRSGRYGV